MIVYHDQHNHQEINNSIQVEIHHIQINVINRYIVHEYHLKIKIKIKHKSIYSYHKFSMVLQVQVILVDWEIFHEILNIIHALHLLSFELFFIPQIFSGASSSSKIGWLRNISRDFKHNPRTSLSLIWTTFPGRHPRTI